MRGSAAKKLRAKKRTGKTPSKKNDENQPLVGPLSGLKVLVRLSSKEEATRRQEQLQSLGADVVSRYSREVSHVVSDEGALGGVQKALQQKKSVVNSEWVDACLEQRGHTVEEAYLCIPPPASQYSQDVPLIKGDTPARKKAPVPMAPTPKAKSKSKRERKVGAMSVFREEREEEMRREHPKLKAKAIQRMITVQWDKLSRAEKLTYEKKAEQVSKKRKEKELEEEDEEEQEEQEKVEKKRSPKKAKKVKKKTVAPRTARKDGATTPKLTKLTKARADTPAKLNRGIRVAFSGSEFDTREWLPVLRKLDLQLSEDMDQCTHLVISTNKRTLKVLKALSRGLWLVKPSWLYSGLSLEGTLPSEREHEASDWFPGAPAARRVAAGNATPVFHGVSAFVTNRTGRRSGAQLRELLQAGGATMRPSSTHADYVVATSAATGEERSTVTSDWVIESLVRYELCERGPYAPK